jgi:hypothetical protein
MYIDGLQRCRPFLFSAFAAPFAACLPFAEKSTGCHSWSPAVVACQAASLAASRAPTRARIVL